MSILYSSSSQEEYNAHKIASTTKNAFIIAVEQGRQLNQLKQF